MKQLTTILCCLAFGFSAIMLAVSDNTSKRHYSTINAAEISLLKFPRLPFTNYNTVKSEHIDTVFIPESIVLQAQKPAVKVKPIYLPAPIKEDIVENVETSTDSIKNKVGVVREEQTTDSIGPPKVSIILVVDGEEVYKR